MWSDLRYSHAFSGSKTVYFEEGTIYGKENCIIYILSSYRTLAETSFINSINIVICIYRYRYFENTIVLE